MDLDNWMEKQKNRIEELKKTLNILRRDPLSMVALFLILGSAIVAIFAPIIAPYPGQGRGEMNIKEALEPPSLNHILGTDNYGRDIFSRILFGLRISLRVAIIVIAIVGTVGTILGAVAGFYGGKVDQFIMRTADLFLSFPYLLLAIAIVAVLGPNLLNAMLAISISWWPWYARIARSEAISLKEEPFIEASRAAGLQKIKIVFKHILPNSITPIIVEATLDMGYVIIAAAGLSFLGLGAQPPAPDLGLMVSNGREFIFQQWWYATFPGAALFFLVFAFNSLGDGIRTATDPKLRR